MSSINSIYYRGRLGCHIIESMIKDLKTSSTLYASAISNRVNIKTAFRYRHLLLNHLHNHLHLPKLSHKVQIDETMIMFPGSLKQDNNKRRNMDKIYTKR